MTDKLLVGLAATVTIGIGSAHALPSSQYVPAGRIPCHYGLPPEALYKLPPQRLFAAVRVYLDEHGKVKDAVLEKSSGDSAFDSLAVRQSRQAICKPFFDVGGNPVQVETNFTFAVESAELRPDPSSESFAAQVERRIRANVVWDGETGHLQTTISVRCSTDGKLLSAKIVRSSGNPAWDVAALKAVQRSDPMPTDIYGRTPKYFKVTVQPGPA
ncbi:TonB family protein [Paraburkholderia adhaesiva]|uniref:TonB family protein n=1 Tax=Paraburkholderia adhaesiva TaxID=2883244 RepID=UPI001F3F6F41|nr:TonB family protein [Paraburkholderia adhaesiva]